MRFLQRNMKNFQLIVADMAWFHLFFASYADALESISKYRREKTLRYRFDKDRNLSALASILLDMLLSQHDLSEKNMEYTIARNGKPYFTKYLGLHFNLAHSEQMAAAILGEVPVGIDVEYLPTFPRDIAEPFKWTEMECVGKLIGCGVGSYIDNESYVKPPDVGTQHLLFDNYLICAAWKHHSDKKTH